MSVAPHLAAKPSTTIRKALIEEARQRARRRRLGYGAAALLVVAGVVASFIGFRGSGGGGAAVPGRAPAAQGTPASEHTQLAGATPGCWQTLLNDAYDGYINSGYSVRCYTSALRRLPNDGAYYALHHDVHRLLAAGVSALKARGVAVDAKSVIYPGSLARPPARTRLRNDLYIAAVATVLGLFVIWAWTSSRHRARPT